MDLRLKARGVELNGTIEEYARKRLAKLDRRLRQQIPVELELRQEGTASAQDRYVAQVTAQLKGTTIRGEERGPSLNAAINAVSDVMDRQISRYKSRFDRRGPDITEFERSLAEELATVEEELGAAEEEDRNTFAALLEQPQVVRTKHYVMRPMLADEAAYRMDLLGHTFFVFLNSETDSINVIYRRHDGDYGLIIPEVED